MTKKHIGAHLITSMVCFCLTVATSFGATFTYSDQTKQIKAGVVVLESTPLVNPYVFFIMNQRQDLKPSGWEFYNPLAPTHVTPEIAARWGSTYTAGQTVSNDMGCYWEIPISKYSSPEIAQFDVLLLPITGNATVTSNEREKLRKFVDNGGILWIQNLGDGQLNQTPGRFFIEDLRFGASQTLGSVTVAPLAFANSLVNRPFRLFPSDLDKIGTAARAFNPLDGSKGVPDDRYFISVLMAGGKSIVSIAQYGGGYIVAVGAQVSKAITDPVGTNGGRCGTAFPLAESEDLKLAYNIVSLGSQHTTAQRIARRPGCSFAEVGAPLSTLWEFHTPSAPTSSSPAILDDMVFYVDGLGFLHAFELSPGKDRDMDGNPDDGLKDPPGAQYDELWNARVGPASAPTVAYVPLGSGAASPFVFVTLQSAQVAVFDARTGERKDDAFDTSGLHAFQPDPVTGILDIPSPIYSDGTVYLADGAGFLHARNYFAGAEWVHPQLMSMLLGRAHALTAGYYYDPASGATEQVVYVARKGDASHNPPIQGSIANYPIRVFGERLTRVNDPDPNKRIYAIRSQNTPIIDGTWRLFYISATQGIQPVVGAQLLNPGKFDLTSTSVPDNAEIIADYELDYSKPGANPRRPIDVKHDPQQPADGAGIACSPATSKKDILYFASDNGSLYAVKDTVRGGELTYLWRWHMKPDVLTGAAPLGFSQEVRTVGSPAVAGDMVYFVVNDAQQGYLLAFKADPVFVINVGKPIKRGSSVRIQQVDVMNSDPVTRYFTFGGGTSSENPRSNATYVVDYDSGKITITNFRNGNQYLSSSHDLTVSYIPEGADQYEDHAVSASDPAAGDKWNNLVWCMRLADAHGSPLTATSSPMVLGDILYVGCSGGHLVSIDVTRVGRGRTGPADGVSADWAHKNSLMWSDKVIGNGPIWASVAGSHGMLAVSTADGLCVLYNPVTLIADGNRLVQMDAGGRVVWSCDSTVEIARSTRAETSGPAVPVYGTPRVPFNKPSVAKRAPVGGIIVADTGNNRVVHIDTGGMILWQITDFSDPQHKLPAGSPLSLNRPRDVVMWVTQDANSYPEYHYLIADSGNYRLVEVVARYNPTTYSYKNELEWVSKTLARGQLYEYSSVSLFYEPDPDNSNAVRPAIVATVTNRVVNPDTGAVSSGGALIKITGMHVGNEQYQIFNGLPLDSNPAISVTRPVFFTRQYLSTVKFTDVAVESDRICVVDYDVDPSDPNSFVPMPRPVYTAQAYFAATGVPLAAGYAQVLPNGNLLVTNRATTGSGNTPSSNFKGEVFVLVYDQATRQWSIAERVGASSPNSTPLQQPASAERQVF